MMPTSSNRTARLAATLIAVAAFLGSAPQATAQVVVDMPRPASPTPERQAMTVPPRYVGDEPKQVGITVGELALHRYRHVRDDPDNQYYPIRLPGIRYDDSIFWNWPFFGPFFHVHPVHHGRHGHHHHGHHGPRGR